MNYSRTFVHKPQNAYVRPHMHTYQHAEVDPCNKLVNFNLGASRHERAKFSALAFLARTGSGLSGLVLHLDLDRLLEGDLLFENFSYDIRKSAMTSL